MSHKPIFILTMFLCALGVMPAHAQESEQEYNPLSLTPISRHRQLYKKTLWWRIDLNEKQNQPYHANDNEISRIIIDAVKKDLLVPYINDSVQTRMPKKTFIENISIPDEGGGLTEAEKAAGFEEEDWGDEWDGNGNGGALEVPEADEFSPRDLSVIEIKEDWYFDKIRSKVYHDIHVISLVLPADKNPAQYEKPIASFRFKDVANLFYNMPERAIWFNERNMAKHLNMADALILRLFNGVLVKIANPADNRIVDIYSNSRREAILASQQLEHQLVEFETQLWEY